MSQSQSESGPTTVTIPRDLKGKLDDVKPYPSMSYADLFRDMLEAYEPPKALADGGER